MSTGEELKQALGLQDFKYTPFVRMLGPAHNILIVYYNSQRPNIPLTIYNTRRQWNILSARKYDFESECPVTPMMPLEDYNGNLSNTLTFCVDMAGVYADKDRQIKNESVSASKRQYEWMTFKNLNTADIMSDFTKYFRKERNKVLRPENYLAKLIDCVFDEKEDSVTFIFRTRPTFSPDKPTYITNPDNGFMPELSPDDEYIMKLKVLQFMKWLKETRPDEMNGQPISWREIKDVLEVAFCKVGCNCMAYWYQGIGYWMSQLDGSIYDCDIKPKRWNAPHLHGDGNAFVCKHLGGLLRSIDFFANQMTSKLNKVLKEKGLI